MIKSFFRVVSISTLVVLFFSSTTKSQSTDQSSLASWIALDAPPGSEHLATDVLMKSLAGWQRDTLGNLKLVKGSGSPRRVVACGIDRPGFAVTEITDDGYIRFREAGGAARMHPLWTQFHEGQRIRVLTRAGSIPGVITVRSTHIARRIQNPPLTVLDDLWLDVGAGSRAEVARLGIQMLDPIVRELPIWSYSDYVSGPSAASRVGCAAVASASRGEVTAGETTFLITTLRSFRNDGLTAALRSLGKVDEITVFDSPADGATDSVNSRKLERPAALPSSTGLTSFTILSQRVRYARTLVESVHINDANALLTAVEKAAGVQSRAAGQRWINLPARVERSTPVDSFSSTANLLKSLADAYSVSGHEREVRERIKAALPEWARQKATVDEEGNLIVEVGPDRDPMMFIAHSDEVGYEITNIADDGTVSLRTRGGMFQSLWEGQPALLHFDQADKPPIKGVFNVRDTATTKQPEMTTAWFGLDGAALKRLGVVNGQSVTAFKSATRLAATRFTARALDDRAGSTALILAARRINPSALKRKLILAWAVREETGLEGAAAMAKKYGPTVKRVYSIDTFVSSDAPGEITRFANAQQGKGAVVRGLDNSSVVMPTELDRILNIARVNGIPLQVGATNGGTDGSEFVPYGVIHVCLSWPGRYSHSPVEVLDLRDLESLAKLVVALSTN